MSTWLITGGAGYVGSHVVRELVSYGLSVVVVDNLSTGIRHRVPEAVPLLEFDCSDSKKVANACATFDIKNVMHFAASKQARESMRVPFDYWDNNIGGLLGLLKGLRHRDLGTIIISSSCSIYGSGRNLGEGSQSNPVSPYGETKLVSERIVSSYAEQYGINWLSLRYFNVIGNGDFPFAYDTSKESLVPATYDLLTQGLRPEIFGSDFETPDGSALRDYVDVRDIATAHARAAMCDGADLRRLMKTQILNLGSGRPRSVMEIVQKLKESMGADHIQPLYSPRRQGDPAEAWASSGLARKLLGWRPKYNYEDSLQAFVNLKLNSL